MNPMSILSMIPVMSRNGVSDCSPTPNIVQPVKHILEFDWKGLFKAFLCISRTNIKSENGEFCCVKHVDNAMGLLTE